jgi:hypothetical protein
LIVNTEVAEFMRETTYTDPPVKLAVRDAPGREPRVSYRPLANSPTLQRIRAVRELTAGLGFD